jgi:hypothetical protein
VGSTKLGGGVVLAVFASLCKPPRAPRCVKTVAHNLSALREHLVSYQVPLTRVVPRTEDDDPKLIDPWM